MNDDVIGKVADAAERAFDHSPSDDPWDDVARAAVAAHTEYLLALGCVTEDAIGEAVSWDYAGKIAHVSILIARAVAQAVADKDAEIERLRRGWVHAELACGCLRTRRVVARAEALRREWAGREVTDGEFRMLEELRAALADEDGAA